MGLVRATHLGDAFSDDRLGDDELRLSARGGLRLGNGVGDFRKIVAIDLLDIPAVGHITRGGVLALRHRCHRVERHIVGIINEDEVVESEVAGERAGFLRHAFLQAPIARERDDMVIENPVRRRVETRLAHLAGNREAHGVRHALPEGAGGCFNARRFVKLWMPRRDAVELAEIFQVIQRHAVACEMQPTVEEHAPVAGRENKAVAIQPARLGGVEGHCRSEERGSDVGGSKREAEVAGFAFGDGIHGQTAGIACGEFERGGIEVHDCLRKHARKTPGRHEGKPWCWLWSGLISVVGMGLPENKTAGLLRTRLSC